MDPLLSLLIGASGGAAVAVITGIFGILAERRKNTAEDTRQLRELASKLTLEQWKIDAAEWEDGRLKLKAASAFGAEHIPPAQITATYRKIIQSIQQ
jgi:hypothetical protein